MKALPPKVASIWVTADCDPDRQVRFLIEPLTNKRFTRLSAAMAALGNPDGAEFAYEVLRHSLQGIEGLEGFQLEIVSGVVTPECIEQIPRALFAELLKAAMDSSGLTEAESDNVDFTSGSQHKGSNVTDEKQAASTDAPKADSSSTSAVMQTSLSAPIQITAHGAT